MRPPITAAGDPAFCDRWDPSTEASQDAKHYGRHVARHLQTISLASIPLSIDGLQIIDRVSDNQDGSNSEIDLNQNEESHEHDSVTPRLIRQDFGSMRQPSRLTRAVRLMFIASRTS
ncbi:hypothetical protein F5B18DRAFT_612975 [Nemania serpens]|nr:hypothetical protein F5B18DRAFT_612975 [Nemania serpens]